MRKKYYEIRKINKKKLILYKERRCSQMKPQLKFEIDPKSLVYTHLLYM